MDKTLEGDQMDLSIELPPRAEDYLKIPIGRVRIVQSVPDSLDRSWEESYAGNYLKHSYYRLLQDTLGEQFDHYFLILEKSDGRPHVQPLFLVRQSILKGLPASLRQGLEKWMQRWFPSVCEVRTLMVGCSAGEGALGGRECDQDEVSRILHETLPEVARRLNASLIVLKDFPSSYRTVLKYFPSNGYARIPSFPSCRIDLAYRDFDDYMERALSYKTRKNLRRKFRDADRLDKYSMEVLSDLTPVLDEIYPLYHQVISRSQFQFEVLTREYFSGLGAALEGSGRFFVWRDSRGKIVAFNICVLYGKILRDCYIGLDYEIALSAHLYFVSLRDIFSWAMENNVEQYYTSALNYSPKLHLKLELAPLDLYIRHVSPVINFFFRHLIPFLEPTRYDPVLSKFPNFPDLR
ncbi:GNAT family N-acetyltransferase [Nitrosovibrio tenuis]|uniref:GNAT family N-acetyltransferase n=1 Tax=Nitrosovibrio tenuis TaxID=1233 RepID=UPI0015A6184D|nr:GNAT family N-acetyltransferase [Nitrosovibrio tenuis]